MLDATVAVALKDAREVREQGLADVVQVFRTSDPAGFRDAPTVVAITGMERLIYGDHAGAGEAGTAAQAAGLAVISSASAVAVPSEVARRDVIGRVGRSPADVTNVGATLAPLARGRWGPTRAVVVPGAVTPHRNAEGAIAAYAALPLEVQAAHRLVLGTGRGDLRRHLRGVARAAGVSAVATAAVPRCLRHAAVAVFPTFWDGYAPGAAEALALGVPIVASTASAAAELAADPELVFGARDAAGMARALARALAGAHARPAPRTASDPGMALRVLWEHVAARREVLQPSNLLPSVSDRTA